MLSLEEAADTSFIKGDFHSAVLQYEQALDKVFAGSQRHVERERVIGGRFAGEYVTMVRIITAHRIHLGLAKAHFHLQHFELAHHWTFVVVYDIKVGSSLLAYLWYYRALASKRLGKRNRAFKEIQKAFKKRPQDQTILAEMSKLDPMWDRILYAVLLLFILLVFSLFLLFFTSRKDTG